MGLAELFVKHVQQYVPTLALRLLVRAYLKFYAGWRMRGGAVVVDQIAVDRSARVAEPVTVDTDLANEQHYGNDPHFFRAHLGPRLKYSACEWPSAGAGGKPCSLGEAEDYTIAIYQEKAGLAGLAPGARVLELGCGWGSLSLANAAKFPKLQFVSFSNSPQQIGFIREQCKERGITNLAVHVEDYAVFCTDQSVLPSGARARDLFDAAFAIETIEHARDIRTLLDATCKRLKPGAKFFVHSLLHQSASYLVDGGDWMGRNFFSGGSILALNSYFHLLPDGLRVDEMTPVRGHGYSRTLLAFNRALEREYKPLCARYGVPFVEGFRAFYIVCAEAFSVNDGCEYMVGWYTFVKRA